MSAYILNPLVAFLINVVLVALLYAGGRLLAGPSHATPAKRSTYSSGEAPPTRMAAPGYRPYFVVALFFAILHLGVLVLGTSIASPIALVYLVGLMVALIALILG
jgi:NADH:ubiquinone oxidoreductase subunit 3 (subunit A)